MIANDPAKGLRRFALAFIIAVILLTAALVWSAQAAPEMFGYIQPFCSMFYTVNGVQYYIQNLGYAPINGIPLMQYQVYWRNGSTWDFLANGLLGYQETHSESANIPAIIWSGWSSIAYSSSDPAKRFDRVVCLVSFPLVMR